MSQQSVSKPVSSPAFIGSSEQASISSENVDVHNTLNVLILDGGGVRGLSSLIILESLVGHVETVVNRETGMPGPRLPHQIFDLVVGTSTGGLIALMIGKLGMSVDRCINQYHDLSHEIFGRGRHIRGTTMHGLRKPKYCSKVMREQIESLFRKRRLDASKQMTDAGFTNCAVVCRKYDNPDTRDEDQLVDDPSVICSLQCLEYFPCTICEAGRATSAAPTYFSPQQIGNDRFIDGAIGFNNPSLAAYDHYNGVDVRGYHPGMEWRGAQMVNIGTGTSSRTHPRPRRRDYMHMPWVISLLRHAATNSEREASIMKSIAMTDDIKYQRFSADTGVFWIKLDAYRRLEDIRNLTNEYLARREVQERLRQCAEGIAANYIRRIRNTNGGAAPVEQNNGLDV